MAVNTEKPSNIALYIINQLKIHNRSCGLQHGSTRLSSIQLANKILSIGQHLQNQGVSPFDVVATKIDSPIDQIAGAIAISLIGATVLRHPNSTPKEKIQDWDQHVKTKWLVSDSDEIHAEDYNFPLITIKDLPKEANITAETIGIQKPQAPWLIATGSGSTGNPKLMPISHLQQIERCEISKLWVPYNNKGIFTSLVGCNFYMGLSRNLECLTIGAKINLNNSISELHQLDETTIIYGMPFHIHALLKAKETNPALLANLKSIIISGDFVSKDLRNEAHERLNANIFALYGCNESYSCCIASPPKVYGDDELVGKSIEGFTIEIVDEKKNNLPINKIGQIRIKSKCSITHYLNDPQQNQKSFRDGYVYPGDLGFFDECGQLHFKGRSDGMMIFNGINIYPQEIQKCLLSHPNIKDVAITSFKHKIYGDLPIAFVELSDPKIQTTELDLKNFASTKLSNYHIHQLIILKTIPRDERGKLPKEELIKLAAKYSYMNKKINQPLTIEKVFLGRKLRTGRFLLSISEHTEAEVRRACQSINLILGTSLKLLHTSPDPTMKMAAMACELTSIFLEEANIPHNAQPTFIPLAPSRKQERIYILSFHQFPNGVEHTFSNIMKMAHKILYSFRTAIITKQQSIQLRGSIKRQIYGLLKPINKHGYGKASSKLVKHATNSGTPFLFQNQCWIQYGWGNQSITMLRSAIASDSSIGAAASANKFDAAQLLKDSGFPVPNHVIAATRESASRIAKSIKNWPVVVKPIDGNRGEGVTTGVASETEVLKAFDYASQNGAKSKRVLIEETIPGTCHRIFVANDNLIYCVKRKPIGITGNGIDSVKKIITTNNESAQARNPYGITDPQPRLDQIAIETLKNAGLNPSSIPALNEFVALRPIETTAWGGIDEEYTDQIHEDNVQLAIQAAKKFHLLICGVDIISNDISIPWHQNGAKINEINFSPTIGGGEASIRTIPKLFRTLLATKGVIPINIFVGASSDKKAQKKFGDLMEAQKEGIYLIDSLTIKGPDRKLIHQERPSLYNNLSRCLANQNCAGIVIAIKDNDVLWSGLPINQCESIDICDTKLYSFNNPGTFATDIEYQIIKQEVLSIDH